MSDDDDYFPQQFGLGSLYDLRDGDVPPSPRLRGLRSVKNLAGGVVRLAPPAASVSIGVGFHRPPKTE